jgi:ferredoxin
MAIIITEECINCGACEPECPNNAIYEAGVEWSIADGTKVQGFFKMANGSLVDVEDKFSPISNEVYFIVPDKCTECTGFHEEPQCAAVCPVDCCVPDPDHAESVEVLLDRKETSFVKFSDYSHFQYLNFLKGLIFEAWNTFVFSLGCR